MEKKLKPFIISLGTYKYDVMVCIASDELDIAKTLLKYGIEQHEYEGILIDKPLGRAIIFEQNQMLLYVRDYPNTPATKGVLAHEIFHIVEIFLGVKLKCRLNRNSAEPYAYLIQHITEQIYKYLDK